jgi:hypothetical protein
VPFEFLTPVSGGTDNEALVFIPNCPLWQNHAGSAILTGIASIARVFSIFVRLYLNKMITADRFFVFSGFFLELL